MGAAAAAATAATAATAVWHVAVESRFKQLSLIKKGHADMPAALRRDAKKIFAEPYKITPFRCNAANCPEYCRNPEASSWGLLDERALYGHLCFYHRGCNQYYEMQQRFWDQDVASALQQRKETTEELLNAFENMLHAHNYELKTTTVKVARHRRQLLHIITKLQVPLSRQLAEDSSAHEQIENWDEEKTGHGHFMVSMRWFKKFCEISAVEEMLASLSDGEEHPVAHKASTVGHLVDEKRLPNQVELGKRCAPQESQLLPGRCSEQRFERKLPPQKRRVVTYVDPLGPHLDLEGVTPIRKIKNAADPFKAVLRQQEEVPAREEGHRSGARTSREAKDQARVEVERPAHPLAHHLACVATGDRSVAERVSEREEISGPCSTFLQGVKVLDQHSHAPEVLSADVAGHCWLWAFCGVRPSRRQPVLEALVKQFLGSGKGGELLERLLCVASSPNMPPIDILHLVPLLIVDPGKWNLNFMLSLAKSAFKPNRLKWLTLLEEKWPWTVRLTVFGAILARELVKWPNCDKGVDDWWQQFQQSMQNTSSAQWLGGVCFASGFRWTLDPSGARAAMEEIIAKGEGILVKDMRNLQDIARQAIAKGETTEVNETHNLQEIARQATTVAPAVESASVTTETAKEAGLTAEQLQRIEDNRAAALEKKRPPEESVHQEKAGLTAEQLKRIEQNRAAALEKKRPREESVHRESSASVQTVTVPQVDAHPATAAAHTDALNEAAVRATQPRPVATPVRSPETLQSIRELERLHSSGGALLGRALLGRVQTRSDFATGTGFRVRLKDSTGEIDVKFWSRAADDFKERSGLQPGAVLQIQGFKTRKLTGPNQIEFAPAGRSIELVFDNQSDIQIEVLSLPTEAEPSRDLTPAEAIRKPERTVVSVIGWVVAMSDLQDMDCKDGKQMVMRELWLAEALDAEVSARARWVLWNDMAQAWGPKSLYRKKIVLRGARVKQPPGNIPKELTGGFRSGGISIVQQ